jgi:hypothetical protein
MSTQIQRADQMRAEYDFSSGVRGKHHEAYRAGTNVVLLEPDLVAAFPDSASVNRALRRFMKLSRQKPSSGDRPNKGLHSTTRARKKAKPKSRSRAARG